MLKKLLAVLSALALGLGMAVVTALPAAATNTNKPSHWETLPDEECWKTGYSTEDSGEHPYTLPAPPSGWVWSKVIVKAGSTGHSVTDENEVYTDGLVEGATFVHPEKDSISHVIVCKVPAPDQVEECVVVAWTMPSWVNSTTPTWKQHFFTKSGVVECDPPNLHILDDDLLKECDTQFQIDMYYNSDITKALIDGGVLNGPHDPFEDFPSPSGWNITYKLLKTGDCIEENAVASATVTPASCDAPGSVSFTITNADWNSTPPTTPGTHTITATAHTGHAFPGGDTTREVTYTIAGQLDPQSVECLPPEPEWEDSVCSTFGQDTQAFFTLVARDGITYMARIGDGDWYTLGAGEYASETPFTVYVNAYRGDTLVASWQHHFMEKDCWNEAIPVEPIISQAVCEGPGDVSIAGFELTAVEGVSYTVLVNGTELPGVTTGVFIELQPGDTFQVKAVGDAENNYYVGTVEMNTVWFGPYTIKNPDCTETISIAGDPVAWTDVCDDEGGLDQGFTIVAVEHVSYTWTLNGVEQGAIEPGTYPAGPGDSVVITAHADTGYELDAPYSWAYAFNTEGVCDLPTHPIVTPQVTFTQFGCENDGSYTLSTVEAEPGSVIWTVNGGEPFTTTGTFTVTEAGVVTITAEPALGYGFAGEHTSLDWSYTYAENEACGDLETLPLTGGAAAGGLGLAGAFLLAGTLLMVARRQKVGVRP